MRTTHLKAVALTALGLALAVAAFADAPVPRISGGGASIGNDYYLNLTPLNKCGGSISNGYAAYGANGWFTAQSFIPTATGQIAQMVVGLSKNGGNGSTSIYAELHDDDGLGHPGALLATSNVSNVTGLPSYPSAKRVSITFSGGPVINAGQSYVMVFTSTPTSGASFVDGTTSDAPCTDGHWSQDISDGNGYVDYPGDAFRGIAAP